MAIKNLLLVNRDAAIDPRQRRFDEGVSQILNALLRNGSITQTGTNPPSYSVVSTGSTNYTPPDNSAFAWVNQQSATITTYNQSSILDSGLTPPATDSVTARVMALPAAPYTIIMALKFSVHAFFTDERCGICWRESSSGKIEHFGPRLEATLQTPVLDWTKWTNPTTFSAHRFVGLPMMPTDPLWLKLHDENTGTRGVSISPNGNDWINLQTAATTNFMTPNQVGFCTVTPASQGRVMMQILSWSVA